MPAELSDLLARRNPFQSDSDSYQPPGAGAGTEGDSPDYFTFGDSVGRDGANLRQDVIKAQTLLGNTGHYDLSGTDGPTGWYGKPLEIALRRYQKDNGLTVDGIMHPGGETLSSLGSSLGDRFRLFPAPTPEEIDDHHDRIARGQDGLLELTPASSAPEGVKIADDGALSAGAASETGRPKGDQVAQVDEVTAGTAALLYGLYMAGSAVINNSRTRREQDILAPQQDPAAAGGADPKMEEFRSQNRATLAQGVADAFGDRLESRGKPETQASNDAVIRACQEVIEKDSRLQDMGIKHIAGGTEDGAGDAIKKERGIKEGWYRKGGKGSSFPDVLFRDNKGNFIPFNTVTQNAKGEMVPREDSSWQRLLYNIGHEVAGHIGKKDNDTTDEEYYEMARQKCQEVFDKLIEELKNGDRLDQRWGDKVIPDAAPGDQP